MRKPSKNLMYLVTVISDEEVVESHVYRGLWRVERKDGSTWIKLTPHKPEEDDPNQMEFEEVAPQPDDHSPMLKAPEPTGA
jgi:hypothetical protein